MLRVVDNQKPQSRPENYYNSAKLEVTTEKKEIVNNDFEPLVIARPTEIIEKLLPRFDSSVKKLFREKTDGEELLDSKCNSISHANSTKNGIAEDPAIATSPDCDPTSHAKSTNGGVTTNLNYSLSAENNVIDQNTESKFEISKYDTQKERDDFLLKLLCENRERRKSIVSENAKARDIENKCTLQKEKVDGGVETPQQQCTLTVCGVGELSQRTPSLHNGGGGASH
jgi:hypothetical protein